MIRRQLTYLGNLFDLDIEFVYKELGDQIVLSIFKNKQMLIFQKHYDSLEDAEVIEESLRKDLQDLIKTDRLYDDSDGFDWRG